MPAANLSEIYRGYIACLNARDWPDLGRFVHEAVAHNGRPFGLAGYRAMLEADYRAIPDLSFNVDFLVVEPPRLASRLTFACAPEGRFLGLDVDGRRVSFAENVFYEFEDEKIIRVWSIVDKTAIEAQLATTRPS